MKDSMNKLPMAVLTDFISKGWVEISNIQTLQEQITSEFSDAANISEILQDLADSYLICVGRLEKYLDSADYIEQSAEEAAEEADNIEQAEEPIVAEVQQNLDTDNDLAKTELPVAKLAPDLSLQDKAAALETMTAEVDDEDFIFSEDDFDKTDSKKASSEEDADFIMDFEDDTTTEPKMTDQELEDLLNTFGL